MTRRVFEITEEQRLEIISLNIPGFERFPSKVIRKNNNNFDFIMEAPEEVISKYLSELELHGLILNA